MVCRVGAHSCDVEQRPLPLAAAVDKSALEENVRVAVEQPPGPVAPPVLPAPLVDIAVCVRHVPVPVPLVVLKLANVNLAVGKVVRAVAVAAPLHVHRCVRS